jgi:predicted Zn-dependent peptidase
MNATPAHGQPTSDVLRLECAGVPALLRSHAANEVVAMRLYWRGGSTSIEARQAGVELFYGRAARRGTQRFAKEELNAALARMGTEIGTGASEDHTLFQMRCLRRHLAASWEILSDIVFHPRLAAPEVEIVRNQMLHEIRQRREEPDGRLGDLAREHTFTGHPYAIHPAGTEDSVRALDATALAAHAGRRLARRHLLLVVVGEVGESELQRMAGATFAGLPEGAPPQPAPPLRFDTSRLAVEERELPTNYVLGQFAAPNLADPGHPAALLALSILRDRLFEEVRTKRNLSYAPGAGLGNQAANVGWIYVTCVDPASTLPVMRETMQELCDRALAPKELADRVRVYVTRNYLQNETNQAQAGFLASYELLGGGWEKSRGFVARLEALRPEDVQSAARQMLRHIQYAVLGDPARADPALFVDP